MRAGSKNINFRGIALNGTTEQAPATIPGVYEAIESAYPDKELILNNVNYSGAGGVTFSTARSTSGQNFIFVINPATVGTSPKGTRIYRLVVMPEDKVYVDSTQDI